MSALLLIRHGQASLLADDYDQLSDLGRAQARALGDHLLARPAPVAVFVGPRRRQRDTHAEVAGRFAAARRPLPEPQPLAELDEHAGQAVFLQALQTLPGSGGPLAAAVERLGEVGLADREALLTSVGLVLQAWGEARLPLPADSDLESFADFRARVRTALAWLRRPLVEAGTAVGPVWAFTSAGVIAAAVGEALNLADGPAVELGFHVENGSLTELLPGHPSSRTAFALKRFNQVHHLAPEQLTSF